MRWWSSKKPNFFEEDPVHPQKVGVWTVISRRKIIGPIFFDGTNTIKMFFPKKLTMPIFSGSLTTVIMQQFLEQPHGDEIVNGFSTRRCPCTHHIRDLEYDTRNV
jgi:hypothetical protein